MPKSIDSIRKKEMIELLGMLFLFFLILLGVMFVFYIIGYSGVIFIASCYIAYRFTLYILRNSE